MYLTFSSAKSSSTYQPTRKSDEITSLVHQQATQRGTSRVIRLMTSRELVSLWIKPNTWKHLGPTATQPAPQHQQTRPVREAGPAAAAVLIEAAVVLEEVGRQVLLDSSVSSALSLPLGLQQVHHRGISQRAIEMGVQLLNCEVNLYL